MSWRWLSGDVDPGESRVEIDLRPIRGGTELTVTHSALFNAESRLRHEQGWHGALDKLARHLQGMATERA